MNDIEYIDLYSKMSLDRSRVRDKKNQPIAEGDYVFTRYRGGSHQGEVDKIVMDQAAAMEDGVANPPKVLYTDQHGHHVAHNPSTLEKTD